METIRFSTTNCYVVLLATVSVVFAGTISTPVTSIPEAITSFSTELPECTSSSNMQAVWRAEKQSYDVILNITNIACTQGDECSYNWTKETRNGQLNIISITIQSGDDLNLILDVSEESENSTSHVTVTEQPIESKDTCSPHLQTLLLSSDSSNVTLTEEILRAGQQEILVRRSTEDSGCELMWRLSVRMQEQECLKNREHILCSGKGFCDNFSNTGSYSCRCCPGYVGKYCEERDGCYGNPCQHGGFCVDIAEGLVGTTFQCLCPHGYRGRSCEGEVNLCDRKPCLNNGTCRGNQTDYACDCTRGFTGPDCETNVNECLSNPCVHGVCEDGLGGYKCYCLPGYGGDHCEFEYDECDSSPCINGGACEDLVAGYRCHCGPGYKGRRCQVKVDLCQPNPCPSPAQCVDRGNNYSCVCHPGYNGPGCTQHYDPCYPNPCQNGGSCWPSLDSYFCSCKPSFTGDLCEAESMLASQPLPHTRDDGPGEPDDAKPRRPATPSDKSRRTPDAESDPSASELDRWHNLYLVGTMLTVAATVVVVAVVVCHCRLNKTYLKFSRRLSRSCSEIKQQKLEEPGKFSLSLHGSASEGPRGVPGPLEPVYEATSVDLVESLNAPLIH